MITFAHVDKEFVCTDRQPGSRGLALANLDFSVDQGEFVCVLGRSGCGKTTLLHLVAGFEKPTRGHVRVKGQEVTAPGPDRALVFQDSNLFPWLTVWENVAFGLRRRGMKNAQLQDKVERQLALMRLADAANAYPYALSGGMRQRVAIARVLVLEPDVVLMDEPFSALDALTRERLQDELLQLGHTRRTVLYVTHSVEEAAYLGDRVLILKSRPGTLYADVRLPRSAPGCRTDTQLRESAGKLRACLADSEADSCC